MTSLIDVIFLLLLFFMLSSTFTKFGELPLKSARQSSGPTRDDLRTAFLQISAERIALNGRPVNEAQLKAEVQAVSARKPLRVIASLNQDADAQDLVQVIHQLRSVPQARVMVVN